MTRIRDALLEIRIWWAKKCAMSCLEYSEAERLWAKHDRLVAQRSQAQVARMERRMGLN